MNYLAAGCEVSIVICIIAPWGGELMRLMRIKPLCAVILADLSASGGLNQKINQT